jgi:hypothetical protein
MPFYAIRHKPTGHFLPQPPHMGRGFTHTEPTNKHPPRLHSSLNSAKQALGWWLDGKATEHRVYAATDDSDFRVTKVPARKPEDMEIIQCELSPLPS